MSLIELWEQSPDQLEDKGIQQLIAFAGEGKLLDSSSCSLEFRKFLTKVSESHLKRYAEQCLAEAFPDSGMALQDVVNEIGTRLGASVDNGRYRGTTKHIGYDGLWVFPNGQAIIIEVKTTDAYRIDLGKIADYKKTLIDDGTIKEDKSSILIIVGRIDTGDLEAQIRGSRYAWDIRIISVDALIRLLQTMEELDDPQIIQRIHNILVPREFTRLDEIAEILFSTKEDIVQDDPVGDTIYQNGGTGKKFIPVAFHKQCIIRVQKYLDVILVKKTRSKYATQDDSVGLTISVSKEHDPDIQPNYWFAFHPHQKDFLAQYDNSFVAYGCGSEERIIIIPTEVFLSYVDAFWCTEKEGRFYWHVHIYRDGDKYSLGRKKGKGHIDISKYVMI